jgi:hypothetical protein
LKWLAVIYVLALALIAAHFPRSAARSVTAADPEILLRPILAPAVLRSYGQFLLAGTWPFGSRAGSAELDELISAHGVAGLSDALPRGERAIEAKGGPGRTTYRLASEVYDQITYSAVPDARSGAVLKIGRYLCLLPHPTLAFERPQCFTLTAKGGGEYYRHGLDGKPPEVVRIASRQDRQAAAEAISPG